MQANVLKQNITGGISCILLLLFSFLVVPTGNVEGIEPCPTYLSDGSRPCYYCGVVEIGNPSLIVVDGGYLFIAEDSIASNIHNYNDLFKTDGCFVLAEDYVEMEMFLSESEFEEAMKIYKDAMPIASGKKIEGRTDSFLGKYKLNENPDYYKLYLVQGKMYNQSFIDTRICDYVKVPDYRSDANLHNILFPTPYAYYKVVKPYKKSKEQQ